MASLLLARPSREGRFIEGGMEVVNSAKRLCATCGGGFFG